MCTSITFCRPRAKNGAPSDAKGRAPANSVQIEAKKVAEVVLSAFFFALFLTSLLSLIGASSSPDLFPSLQDLLDKVAIPLEMTREEGGIALATLSAFGTLLFVWGLSAEKASSQKIRQKTNATRNPPPRQSHARANPPPSISLRTPPHSSPLPQRVPSPSSSSGPVPSTPAPSPSSPTGVPFIPALPPSDPLKSSGGDKVNLDSLTREQRQAQLQLWAANPETVRAIVVDEEIGVVEELLALVSAERLNDVCGGIAWLYSMPIERCQLLIPILVRRILSFEDRSQFRDNISLLFLHAEVKKDPPCISYLLPLIDKTSGIFLSGLFPYLCDPRTLASILPAIKILSDITGATRGRVVALVFLAAAEYFLENKEGFAKEPLKVIKQLKRERAYPPYYEVSYALLYLLSKRTPEDTALIHALVRWCQQDHPEGIQILNGYIELILEDGLYLSEARIDGIDPKHGFRSFREVSTELAPYLPSSKTSKRVAATVEEFLKRELVYHLGKGGSTLSVKHWIRNELKDNDALSEEVRSKAEQLLIDLEKAFALSVPPPKGESKTAR